MHHFFRSLLILLLPLSSSAQVFKWDTPSKSNTPPTASTPTAAADKGDKIYTVQVGTFLQPQLSDFTALKSIGQLYAEDSTDKFYDVFLGTFKSTQSAEQALQQVQAMGFAATLAERPKNLGKQVVVIQLLGTQNRQALDWASLEKVGKLYGLMENAHTLKVVTGPFITKQAAANRMDTFRKKGFRDAFVKVVNSQLLTTLEDFEKGKKPVSSTETLSDAIDKIAATTTPTPPVKKNSPTPPTAYETTVIVEKETTQEPTATTPPTPPANAPTEVVHSKNIPISILPTTLPTPIINPRVKRTSALDLQKVLKLEKHYSGSLDGYYGKGTAVGYTHFVNTDYQYNKYQLVAKHLVTPNDQQPVSGLQSLINSLTSKDAGLIAALQRSNHPIAKAYLAHWMYTNQGPSATVNQLLNSAIQESFVNGQVKNAPPFDFTATYDYTTIKQVIQHIRYLHAAPSNAQYAIPCWLFEQHPTEANAVFQESKLATLAEINVSGCLRFDDWQPIKALRYFLDELQPTELSPSAKKQLETHTTGRTFLYLFPEKLTKVQKQEVDQWKIQLWKDILATTNENPLLEKYYPTLKILFFQSQVLVEDFYLQKGFTADEAEGLALSVLKTYTEVPLGVYR